MWLNMIFLSVACLCVGFILGWLVARPRRWGVFAGGMPADVERREDWERFAGDVKPGA